MEQPAQAQNIFLQNVDVNDEIVSNDSLMQQYYHADYPKKNMIVS